MQHANSLVSRCWAEAGIHKKTKCLNGAWLFGVMEHRKPLVLRFYRIKYSGLSYKIEGHVAHDAAWPQATMSNSSISHLRFFSSKVFLLMKVGWALLSICEHFNAACKFSSVKVLSWGWNLQKTKCLNGAWLLGVMEHCKPLVLRFCRIKYSGLSYKIEGQVARDAAWPQTTMSHSSISFCHCFFF